MRIRTHARAVTLTRVRANVIKYIMYEINEFMNSIGEVIYVALSVQIRVVRRLRVH